MEQEQNIIEEEIDISDQYFYCPLCGVNWSNNVEKHKCDKMLLIDNKKPRFYMLDLDNYNEDFLKEIINWQNLKIKALENIDNINPEDVDLKSF